MVGSATGSLSLSQFLVKMDWIQQLPGSPLLNLFVSLPHFPCGVQYSANLLIGIID
jgi:hypothetical protein